MIVQCPSCAARYRIRDANIPPSGGKIRCPSCSHSFIVYPEAQEADDDRTSITSQGEISNLVDQMDRKNRPSAADEDYVATQIAAGSELDKQRAMNALRNEMGDPVDMDGTVEIQNPMKLLKEMERSGALSGGVPPDDTEDEYEEAKTEVVDPGSVQLPFRAGNSGAGEKPGDLDGDATFQLDRDAVDAIEKATKGDSSPGLDPAGNGSGMHPYAQNTPPGGRSPQNRSPQNGVGSGSFDSPPSPQAGGAPAPPPIPRVTTPMDKVSSKPGPTDSGLTAADLFDDGAGAEELPPTVSEQDQQDPQEGPDPNHDGPWKLKTNFGLTYEFPDTRGLRSWLSGREELDGYRVSHDDGATFHSLNEYPQLDKDSGGPAMRSGNVSIPSRGSGQHPVASRSGEFAEHPSGEMPRERSPSASGSSPAYRSGLNERPDVASTTMRGPKVNTEYTVPSRESKYHWVLWLVFLMLLVVAVGIGLQTFGIVDIKGMVLEATGQTETVDEPAPVIAPDEAGTTDQVEPVDPAAAEKKRQREVAKLLEDAERLVERNKLSSALDKLQTTREIAPQNPRVYELIADVHERLGQADDAAKAAAKADELRASAGLEESPDMGSNDASEPQ